MPIYKTYSLWVDEEELLKVHAIARYRNLKTRICASELLDRAIDKSELKPALKEYKVYITNLQNQNKAMKKEHVVKKCQRELLKIDKILRDLT